MSLPPLPALFGSLGAARGLVLAVSGGPDSTALMHLAAAWQPPGLPMHVATVDHGLRPEARHEAEAVMAAAARLGLPATLLTWDGPKPERRLQERARAARYDLLAGFAGETDASHIVTAHTLDDQGETLLMRLAAGSGPAGLAGMRALTRRGEHLLARPLLGIRKATLVALCQERGWSYAEDPGNADARFARARWRQLAPLLAAEGMTPERLGQLAARLARAETALRACAEAAARGSARTSPQGTRSFAAELFEEPDDLVLRVIDAALATMGSGVPPRLARLERLLGMLRQALRNRQPVRRTLRGCCVTLDDAGCLAIAPEPPRRRGRGEAGPAIFQAR